MHTEQRAAQAIQRQRVCDAARTWLSTPYHPHARVKGVGVDCATILAEVYIEAGLVPHVEIGHYSPDWHHHRSEELYLKEIEKYAHEVTEPKAGDIAVWQFGRTFSHGAIVLDWPLIIHAVIDRGVLYGDAEKDGDLLGRKVRFFSPWL